MEISEIHKYLSETKRYFEDQISVNNQSDTVKNQFSAQIDAINNLENWLKWKEKSPAEKQAYRISSLASMRKIDALDSIIKKQEWIITFYECISTTLPYILTLSLNRNRVLAPLEDFCVSLIEQIDTRATDRVEIPNQVEIEKAFDCYYKSVFDKSNSFRECFIRIEDLHKRLISTPTL